VAESCTGGAASCPVDAFEPSGTTCASDENVCTGDTCDGSGTCQHPSNDSACDDGLFCTTDDRCVDGECTGVPICPPTDACSDTCDEVDDACRSCGHPVSNSRCIVNAIVVLQGALGLRPCELCTCDVDSNGVVTTTDALKILRTCVDLPSPLDCEEPPSATTTTTPSTTTTLGDGCIPEGGLDGRVYTEKYTCAQTFEGEDTFCADQNVSETIVFDHLDNNVYQVREVPDTGFVLSGTLDCSVFVWDASSPGEYTENGVWAFFENGATFFGSSAYVAEDLSYAGACNEEGAESPAVPPDPESIPPCD
jgi:hypothetical protein